MEGIAEGIDAVSPGLLAQVLQQSLRRSAVYGQQRAVPCGDNVRRRCTLEDMPLVNQADPVAAGCFIHVGGCREHGNALGFQPVEDIPEFFSRKGVHAGSGLIEQQYPWTVD